MYVADCWVMASCSLVRGQVWEEHTPLYSKYKHRRFDRNIRLCLTEINASEKNTATTSRVKVYPEHGGRTVLRNTHTHHADMRRRSGTCDFCTGFDGDDELSAPRPSGHYMYHQFNIQQFYVLPTQFIYVFCVDLRTNSDYFLIQH